MKLDREPTCAEVVEVVTAYLEHRLPPPDVERLERHLAGCDGCSTYLEQMRATITATGALPRDELPPSLRESLLAAFRDWRAQ